MKENTEEITRFIAPRPHTVRTKTVRGKTACGNAYITISIDPAYPFEVFGILGKTGGCAAAQTASITRLITLARRYGAPIESVIKQLKGTQCPNSSDFLPSCPEAIARALEEIYINDSIDTDKRTNEETKAPGGTGTGEESNK